MSAEAVKWAKSIGWLSSNRFSVLMAICRAADYRGQTFRGQDRLAKDCHISERTVRRMLVELEAKGLISRDRRNRPNGSRTSDLITVHIASEPTGQTGRKPTGQAGRLAYRTNYTLGLPDKLAAPEDSISTRGRGLARKQQNPARIEDEFSTEAGSKISIVHIARRKAK